jgi:hypothetical protein
MTEVDVYDVGANAWHARGVSLDETICEDIEERDRVLKEVQAKGFAYIGGGAAPLFRISSKTLLSASHQRRPNRRHTAA